MNKLRLIACASAVITTACPYADGQQVAGSSGHHCVVQSVEHCIKVTVQGGTMSVDIPEQPVKGLGAGRHWIVWYIDTPGYSFSDDSKNPPITFQSDTRGQFDHKDTRRCYPWKTPQQFCCIDEATQRGRFKYTISVTGPTTVAPLDPFISNE